MKPLDPLIPPGTSRPATSRRFVLYTAGMALGMMLVVLALLRVWPFGGGTILTGDLNAQYINFYAQFKRALRGQGGFAYSFTKGLGGGLWGLFAYYITSPFNLIYLAVPITWFPVATSLIWVCKVVLCCCFAQIWLGHRHPNLSWWSVGLALCYGFSAYAFAYAQNIMWHDVVMLAPLLCLGVDRIVAGKPLTLYALVLALAIFSNFYIAFMACIFLVLYFFYTMLTRGQLLAAQAGWRGPLLRFGAGSLLAGGINAALLLPTLAAVGQSKGTPGGFSFSLQPLFQLSRLPERFAWGSFSISDMEGHLPFVYCGILVTVLAFCYFIGTETSLKHKLLSGGMLLLFILSFWLKGPDTVWHGFSEPVWFPARYSFLFSLFTVMLAARVLARPRHLQNRLPFAGGIAIIAFFLMAAFPVSVSRSRILLSAVAVAFFTFSLMAWLMNDAPKRRRLIRVLVLLVVVAELVGQGYYIISRFERYPLAYFQNTVQREGSTVQGIAEQDESTTGWRVAENGYRSLNDTMLLGYRGIAHFSSVQDAWAQHALYSLGYRAHSSMGPYMNGNTAFADAALGLKYYFDNAGRPVPSHWQPADINAELPVYQNPYALPMAFATMPAVDEADTPVPMLGEVFDWQNALYAAMGGQGAMLTAPGRVVLRSAGGETLSLEGGVPPGARYEVTAAEAGYHYACFNAGYGELAMWVNGEVAEPYFTALNCAVVDLGWLEAGEVATVGWANQDSLSLWGISFARLDNQKLHILAAQASRSTGTLTLSDGLLQGTVTGAKGSFLYTSIPWDAGWQATVNGKPVQPQALMDCLISLPLEVGENTIVLKYVAPGTGPLGWVISGACALALAAAILVPIFKKRRQSTTLAAAASSTPPQGGE